MYITCILNRMIWRQIVIMKYNCTFSLHNMCACTNPLPTHQHVCVFVWTYTIKSAQFQTCPLASLRVVSLTHSSHDPHSSPQQTLAFIVHHVKWHKHTRRTFSYVPVKIKYSVIQHYACVTHVHNVLIQTGLIQNVSYALLLFMLLFYSQLLRPAYGTKQTQNVLSISNIHCHRGHGVVVYSYKMII
jgi:hypothetical protein